MPSNISVVGQKYIRSITGKFPEIKIKIKTTDTQQEHVVDALLDSGATGLYVDTEFVRQQKFNTTLLQTSIPVYNVNGTRNNAGSIKETVDFIMDVQGHKERATFAVTGLGNKKIIIGENWLKKHNPEINWITGDIKFT